MPESHPSVVCTAVTRMAPLVAGAALMSATPASAQSTFELLPATDVRPADGAVLSPRAPDTPFRIVTTPGDGVAAISVKVSTRRATHLRAACTPPGFGGGLGPFAYNCTARFRLSGRPYSALLNVFWYRGRVVAQDRFG